jgi:prephenate dehydratase
MKRSTLIAFQGARGAFSEEAARKLTGPNASVLPCERFEDVFRSLKEGRAAGAIVPIENTLAGSVHENYDHLQSFELPIVAETGVRIVHNLMARPGVRFSSIRRVYSHPVALNQCLDFFAQNPQIERIPFYDTAGSAKMIMEERLDDAGAIASAIAAEIYGARILRRSIESDRQNFTRFFLPLRGKPWEYLFYVDFLERVDSPNAQNALNHLRELADFLRVLGCYPKGA